MKSLIKFVIPIAILIAIFGCSKDKNNNPIQPNNNTFRIVGTVNAMDSTQNTMSGSVTFTVTDNATVEGVFRVVEPSVSSHNLTGTYVDTVNILIASGDGYNFSGILNDTTGMFQGTITGAGTGLVVGALDGGNDSSSVAYCGTYSGPDSGNWNFTIEDNSLYGSHWNSSGDGGVLTGTLSGNVITLYESGVECGAGTRDGDNVSGTWHNSDGTGTWSGSRCN